MNKLQLAQDKLNVKRRELAEIFEAAGPDLDMTAETVAEVKQRNDELTDIGKDVDHLRDLAGIDEINRKALDDAARPARTLPFDGRGDATEVPTQRKSMGDLFVESKAYKEYNPSNNKGPIVEAPYNVKTLLSEGAGFAPQAIRTGQVIDLPQQQPRIVDVIPSTTTAQTAVVFMRESVYTNAAAETTEGGLYPEAALQYVEVNQPVRKIAVFLPVTDEQLSDVEGMKDRINNRLLLMLRQRLDSQIIAGTGVAPNLEGILNTPGILAQAKGTDPNVDAVYKGLTQLRAVGFVEPNAILMHPMDWQNVRLLRTADGMYIFGFPGENGPDRLWGLPVVSSTYVTQGTALPGDYAGYTELAYKAGIEFEVSNSHADFFQRGQLAIRAQLRCAFVILRPSALCEVTGL